MSTIYLSNNTYSMSITFVRVAELSDVLKLVNKLHSFMCIDVCTVYCECYTPMLFSLCSTGNPISTISKEQRKQYYTRPCDKAIFHFKKGTP